MQEFSNKHAINVYNHPSTMEFMQTCYTIESTPYKRTTRTPISASYEDKNLSVL